MSSFANNDSLEMGLRSGGHPPTPPTSSLHAPQQYFVAESSFSESKDNGSSAFGNSATHMDHLDNRIPNIVSASTGQRPYTASSTMVQPFIDSTATDPNSPSLNGSNVTKKSPLLFADNFAMEGGSGAMLPPNMYHVPAGRHNSVSGGSTTSNPTSSGNNQQESQNLFIRHIPLWVDDKVLRDTFEVFGSVVSASVMRHIVSGQSKGHGFVMLASASDAQLALNTPITLPAINPSESNGAPVDQVELSVIKARHNGANAVIADRRRIFVSNVPISVSTIDLRAFFETNFGGVVDCIHQLNRQSPAGTCIAFIEFTTAAQAQEAIKQVHGTKPFGDPRIVPPLMLKISETKSMRQQRHNKREQTQNQPHQQQHHPGMKTSPFSAPMSHPQQRGGQLGGNGSGPLLHLPPSGAPSHHHHHHQGHNSFPGHHTSHLHARHEQRSGPGTYSSRDGPHNQSFAAHQGNGSMMKYPSRGTQEQHSPAYQSSQHSQPPAPHYHQRLTTQYSHQNSQSGGISLSSPQYVNSANVLLGGNSTSQRSEKVGSHPFAPMPAGTTGSSSATATNNVWMPTANTTGMVYLNAGESNSSQNTSSGLVCFVQDQQRDSNSPGGNPPTNSTTPPPLPRFANGPAQEVPGLVLVNEQSFSGGGHHPAGESLNGSISVNQGNQQSSNALAGYSNPDLGAAVAGKTVMLSTLPASTTVPHAM